jgi:hypothetical protein
LSDFGDIDADLKKACDNLSLSSSTAKIEETLEGLHKEYSDCEEKESCKKKLSP